MEQVTSKMFVAVAVTVCIRLVLMVFTGQFARGLSVPYIISDLVLTTVSATLCTLATRRVSLMYQKVLVRSGVSAAVGVVFFIGSSFVVMKGLTSPVWILFTAVAWAIIGLAAGLIIELIARSQVRKLA